MKSRESFAYTTNHHMILVAPMALRELTRSWNAMAQVRGAMTPSGCILRNSYQAFNLLSLGYMHICDYDKKKKKLNWFYNVVCMVSHVIIGYISFIFWSNKLDRVACMFDDVCSIFFLERMF